MMAVLLKCMSRTRWTCVKTGLAVGRLHLVGGDHHRGHRDHRDTTLSDSVCSVVDFSLNHYSGRSLEPAAQNPCRISSACSSSSWLATMTRLGSLRESSLSHLSWLRMRV